MFGDNFPKRGFVSFYVFKIKDIGENKYFNS